ncbi:hypothetical protein Ancab_013626 [Ancistrocladus abbreviatus]
MAAAAATSAIGSSLSTAVHTVQHLHTKKWASDPLLKIGYTKSVQVPTISHSYGMEPISVATFSNKWPTLKIAAAVAQEEAMETILAEGKSNAEVTVSTKLYFGNLPYLCDSAQLAGIVQQYGAPELVEVLYNRDTGKSRGFAFVTMSSIEDCNAVIENLDGSEYGGRFLRVNFADKPRPREPLYPETEHKLFVGNLSWSVTSESLLEAFQGCGNVVGARVLYDGETGRSKGYGFVCYSTRSEMENALADLNEVELEGRPMRVSVAQGKRS